MLLGPVFVDNQEKSPTADVRVAQLTRLEVSAFIAHLPRGDYQWVVSPEAKDTLPECLVVCERKTIKDLIASAVDGRIARFWQGAVDDSRDGYEQLNILLVEGDLFRVSGYGDSSWTPDKLDNLLLGMQMAGVLVAHARSEADCAERIKTLWQYTGRSDRGSTLRKIYSIETEGAYISSTKRAAVRFLMGLPGWGEARAVAALEALGSPEAVLAAIHSLDYQAFAKVKGVGKGLVASAAEFLARAA